MKPVGIPDLWFHDKLLSFELQTPSRLKSVLQDLVRLIVSKINFGAQIKLYWVSLPQVCPQCWGYLLLLTSAYLHIAEKQYICRANNYACIDCYFSSHLALTAHFFLRFAFPLSLIIIHQKYRISIWRRIMNDRTWDVRPFIQWRCLLIKWISFQTICAPYNHETSNNEEGKKNKINISDFAYGKRRRKCFTVSGLWSCLVNLCETHLLYRPNGFGCVCCFVLAFGFINRIRHAYNELRSN